MSLAADGTAVSEALGWPAVPELPPGAGISSAAVDGTVLPEAVGRAGTAAPCLL